MQMQSNKNLFTTFLILCCLLIFSLSTAIAYPPAVGILSKMKNCLSCHVNNGPWKDDGKTIIEIIEKDKNNSFIQSDGSFVIEVKRGEPLTVRTLIAHKKDETTPTPFRNAWLFIDPKTIETNSLSKFAPGWDVNLQMACRLVGDKLEGYNDANLTVLPMTLRPTDAAQNAEITLQVMLTSGASEKGKAKEGMLGNYFERKVILRVKD
ncbi:MAG: hypothetical protein HYZ34_12940 [Ignavibacteriae bacterium]|nr:hypothetical protein [Ignavibacteriota bacterium]